MNTKPTLTLDDVKRIAAAAETGLRDALQTGEFGYPMMNVQAKILDAAFDPQLSTEDAFVRAAANWCVTRRPLPAAADRVARRPQRRSNRSRFITLVQAATKSSTNLRCASAEP